MRLKLKDFTKWLLKQHINKRIKTGCDSNCPIAQYLLDSGYKYASVGHGSYSYVKNKKSYCVILPGWANDFIKDIDDVGENKGTDCVSPRECLKVLNGI